MSSVARSLTLPSGGGNTQCSHRSIIKFDDRTAQSELSPLRQPFKGLDGKFHSDKQSAARCDKRAVSVSSSRRFWATSMSCLRVRLGCAISNEAAQSNRDDAAQDNGMMAPKRSFS